MTILLLPGILKRYLNRRFSTVMQLSGIYTATDICYYRFLLLQKIYCFFLSSGAAIPIVKV